MTFRGVTAMPLRIGVLALGVLTAQVGVAAEKKGASPKLSSLAKKGEYIVMSSGCVDCHTPWVFNKDLGSPVPDGTRLFSGHPSDAPDPRADPAPQGVQGPPDGMVQGPTLTSFRFPFGIVYATNLTPDKETGIGGWTEEMFIKAIRTGKHQGGTGRPILPPMPWPSFRNKTDEDLKAIFAFLKSLPPIHNAVPEPKVPPQAIEAMTQSHPKLLKMLDSMAQHK